jgi:maltose alpha-D-glucosyltransferase/alpha-amylase
METYLDNAARLGQRTAELHLALASDRDSPAFAPEPYTTRDLVAMATGMTESMAPVFEALGTFRTDDIEVRREVNRVLASRAAIAARLMAPTALSNAGERIRVHGDYHLGQVLWAEEDFQILDFEGEPARPLHERRTKQSALKDVAGMLRSYSYAAAAGLQHFLLSHASDRGQLRQWAHAWYLWSSGAFLRAYVETTRGATFVPQDRGALETLLQAFVVEKALYEIRYELNHRPDWLRIPIGGIVELLER